jgi:hypothetical protein
MVMLPMMPTHRKTGSEQFRQGKTPLGLDLLGFWQWSGSDLLGIRTQLAEYIVACALGLGDGICSGWGSHDLQTPGGLKIEVKSSAYLQGWAQKAYTRPIFSIKSARTWNPSVGEMSKERCRPADIYVFTLLFHQDQATLDPLDVDQWVFYVLPTSILNEKMAKQKTLSLAGLRKLQPKKCCYSELKSVVQSFSLPSNLG